MDSSLQPSLADTIIIQLRGTDTIIIQLRGTDTDSLS